MLLRFSLARIPVEVHPTHLFVVALIAYSQWPKQAPANPAAAPWPLNALFDEAAGGRTGTILAFLGIWTAIVFFSVLFHELGHAVVSRAYGYRPTIALVWLGGHTNPNAGETIPWHRDVLLTLAGPGFGFLLALVGLLLLQLTGDRTGVAAYAFKHLLVVNVVWSIFNLIPVLPLDGGRILNAVLVRAMGRKGFIGGQVLAVGIASAGLIFAASVGDLWLVFIATFVGMSAFSMLMRALRGEPVEAPRHPYDLAFDKAKKHYREGELDRARGVAEQLLVAADPEPSPTLKSQAHHLLGWIELKEGRGRGALEHFAGVQHQRMESHALAAAFSLVGDDEKALSLWELAWKETRDRTVLHEYAGVLLRTRSEAEAARLPGVDLALAYTCAVRVLSIRGDFGQAGQLADQGSSQMPHFQLAYDGACALARAGDLDGALRLLERAAAHGFKDWDYAASDADLERLHRDARFPSFLARVRESRVG